MPPMAPPPPIPRPATSMVKREDGGFAMPAPRPPNPKRPADQPLTDAKRPRATVEADERKPSADVETTKTTHAILCIDQSGSMARHDVQPAVKGGERKSRWDAVFDCAVEFVADQAGGQAGGEAGGGGGGGGGGPSAEVVFSLVLFEDVARTVFERRPLHETVPALERARAAYAPRGGTGFAAAFHRARTIASGSSGGVLLLFLSDGRPGDLRWPPPPAGAPVQQTFVSHKQTHPSAAVHLRGLVNDHGARLAAHYVAIHADGHAWLRRLADDSAGTFHDAKLSLDRDDDEVSRPDGRWETTLDLMTPTTPMTRMTLMTLMTGDRSRLNALMTLMTLMTL